MKEYVKRPVTYAVKPYIETATRNNLEDLVKFLKDTPVKIKRMSDCGRTCLLYPPSSGFYEMGEVRTLWNGDVVVVSSLGEVTSMTGAQFKKEFEEA